MGDAPRASGTRPERRAGRGWVASPGWVVGGTWAGEHATLWPERVRHRILHNTLRWSPMHQSLGAGPDLEAPTHPGRFHAAGVGACRLDPASSLQTGRDRSNPLHDKAA